MLTHARTSLWIALLLLAAATSSRGQWRIVAPNEVSGPFYGALDYKDGIIWAGSGSGIGTINGIVYSDDTGKTWMSTSAAFSMVLDISFWSRDSGIVSTVDGIYVTYDRGQHWTMFSGDEGNCYRVITTSATSFYASGFNGQHIESTQDGGATWRLNSPISTALAFMPALTVASNGTLYTIAGPYTPPGVEGSSLYASTDSGITWIASSPVIDVDSYSVSGDSCDPNRFYVSNENFVYYADGYSKIYLTTDAGVTWSVPFSRPTPYLAGGITVSPHAVFFSTIDNGILRSTDGGETWTNIGGNGKGARGADTRNICAVNDNIIFTLDSAGNIWATFNSGGDSILSSNEPIFSASPSTLFVGDTISCDSLTRSLIFRAGGCSPPSVSTFSIIGPDSAIYLASNLTNDSIQVTLIGTKQGNDSAQLVLTLSDGSTDTVALEGFVNNTIPLSFSTQSVQTDTLGGTVAVPITINGLERPENVTLVLHYDGSVDYLGSFSPTGTRLDIPGDSSYGRSVLSITGAVSGVVAGYAKFNVFNDSNDADDGSAGHATFDSLTVLTPTSPCEYSLPTPVTSAMTTLSGCGITMLSQLIHLGVDPVLSIVPNPTDGTVFISSNANLGSATIDIYDMLGTKRSSTETTLASDAPIELQLPKCSGVYSVVIRSASGTRVLRVMEER